MVLGGAAVRGGVGCWEGWEQRGGGGVRCRGGSTGGCKVLLGGRGSSTGWGVLGGNLGGGVGGLSRGAEWGGGGARCEGLWGTGPFCVTARLSPPQAGPPTAAAARRRPAGGLSRGPGPAAALEPRGKASPRAPPGPAARLSPADANKGAVS